VPSLVWFLFVAVALASAVTDLFTYRIPNVLVAVLAVGFLLLALVQWTGVNWIGHFGVGATVLGGCVVFYAFGQMGAGDAKLLGALALWAGIPGVIPLLFWVSLCGLGAMLVILVVRPFAPMIVKASSTNGGLPRVLTKGQGIPYGIGIAPGAIIASFSFPAWIWHF
jgi:prepilin peptidase CpaA